MRETIFALSSGGLPSGVAVIRLSGPDVRTALNDLVGFVPEPRKAVLRTMKAEDGTVLDRGLILFFEGPYSFTGEDCAELQLHGGVAVVKSVLEALGGRENFRAAGAGEFTKRGFLNGKFDLTGAEALADLISAETEAQRRFALANGDERHRQLYAEWRRSLIHAQAMIAAELDFSDEEDVPGSVADAIWQELSALQREIEEHAGGYRDAEIVRDGFRVVILGAPNAGKSSLMNALARRDIAIVTEEAGTTRDILETALDIGGVKVILTDTAGIRENPGRIEAIGIDRAIARAGDADLILLLEDVTEPRSVPHPQGVCLLRIANKIDLLDERLVAEAYDLAISTVSGEGINELLVRIGDLTEGSKKRALDILPFRERHVGLLMEASRHIERAFGQGAVGLELQAEELRLAAIALGRIAGEIDVEDLLDTIFSQFCIGK
ncbi:tRNA uridine-5-carboxymethylaminomethyl(34) synthesis GTPase MnmE [Nitratireductor indicus]|uniref:tRNA uridine-5-carboxymethylaminomethyl(34) synthesis GTPase MnmE n=1 Tax=Nitratireductor indicus TaxID=721133 RepID=UPI002874CBC9|nr:tRNA uridine-5-carboxymethylaminomethyl(34) synthesis GTPase MnmE [Nitratireductor indicus]MDS1136968.1 tRNA uridine-5-carboxymethylaminomethyl(34) synthesis GTPase MnmE [Nitratireductor indicus]